MQRRYYNCDDGAFDEEELRIPFRIDVDDDKMQRGHLHQRTGRIIDFIADDDSWMDNLFLLEDNILERPPIDHLARMTKNTCSQSGDSDGKNHLDEARGTNQALHSTQVERKRQRVIGTESCSPLATADGGAQIEKGAFQTQFVNLMFSAFSIKGWGQDAGSFYYPCHSLHLIIEPILLTMTSFPFRIVFVNDAFLRLRRGDQSVIGSSLFDCFVSDEFVMKPNISQTRSFLCALLNDAGCAIRIVPADNSETVATIPCVVKAHPVVSNAMGAESISYYAMRFDAIRT